jgi:hypothetical protein
MYYFYVCSYGGSGSTMLCNYLKNFGYVRHIHSRNPPNELTSVCECPTFELEWFSNNKIHENNINSYKIIFLYRNPIDVIYSRYCTQRWDIHLKNMQLDNTITIEDVVNSKKDLYKLEEFFDNYTKITKKNYDIYCVKYESFFNNISYFNKILKIPDNPNLYPIEKKTNKNLKYKKELLLIYKSLINKINNMPFIKIIRS